MARENETFLRQHPENRFLDFKKSDIFFFSELTREREREMADDDTIWSNLFLFVDSDGDGKVTTDDMKKVCDVLFKTFVARKKT